MSRDVTRWVAVCGVQEVDAKGHHQPCRWDDREDAERHATAEGAKREATKHYAVAHAGARVVTIRRHYKPRELEREEIVS